MNNYSGERRIITVEFEYRGLDEDDSWVEKNLPERFTAMRDVRVINVRPAEYEQGRMVYETVDSPRKASIFAEETA